jgi:hypothetical protein
MIFVYHFRPLQRRRCRLYKMAVSDDANNPQQKHYDIPTQLSIGINSTSLFFFYY